MLGQSLPTRQSSNVNLTILNAITRVYKNNLTER